MKFILFIFYSLVSIIKIYHSEDCSNINSLYSCQGSQTEYPSDWSNRKFQTPPKGDPLWNEKFQDMNLIVGYTQIKYNKDRTECYLTIITKINEKKIPSGYFLNYHFGENITKDNTHVIKKLDNPIPISIKVEIINQDSIIAKLELEKVDFIWNHPEVKTPKNYENGQKGALVELFGWPYSDIEKECEFIGKAGYLGVKIFPPNESILSYKTVENGELNPWYFLYQPVSYRLNSRHGSREELVSMINTCRKNNVRIYADAVVNHMTGNGNDMFPDHRNPAGGSCIHWGAKDGSDHSPWYTHGYQYENCPYTGEKPALEFPSVPYDITDFHCERGISSWTDPFILNYGWLVGLSDLNTEKEYVRQRIADYLTDLISIGISGFRIDAAKHISPSNLSVIFKKLSENMGGQLPEDFISYLEVIIGGEKDLLMCSDLSSYSYGINFTNKMKEVGLSESDINKIKIWQSDYPKEFPICGYWSIPSERYAIGLDCHDDQNPGSSSRDMGDKGSVLIKEKNVDKHREFEKELFTRTDGNWKIKLILSSYTFIESKGISGFPDGHSDCNNCSTQSCKNSCKSVPYSPAYDPNSCGYSVYDQNGKWLEGVYTRVHRDIEIINTMRRWMGLGLLSSSDLGLPDKCWNKLKFLIE